MIVKESHPGAIKGLRQEQSLRDHGDAVEDFYVSNPKFPDLVPLTAWPGQCGILDIQAMRASNSAPASLPPLDIHC